jgi:hypothetical protein
MACMQWVWAGRARRGRSPQIAWICPAMRAMGVRSWPNQTPRTLGDSGTERSWHAVATLCRSAPVRLGRMECHDGWGVLVRR